MIFKRIFLILLVLSAYLPVSSQALKYVFRADAGLLFGEANIPAPSVNIFNGVKFSVSGQQVEVGIGTGADIYQEINFIPLSGGGYGYLRADKLSRPFFGFNAGYGLAWKENLSEFTTVKGGLMLNPIAGMDFKLKNSKISLRGLAGYKEQRGSKTFDNSSVSDFPTIYVEDYTFKRIYIGFGLGF